jgi:hypothetical protein
MTQDNTSIYAEIAKTKEQYQYDKDELNTESVFHQFIRLKEDHAVIKRYTKANIGTLSFFRYDPNNPKLRLTAMLKTTMHDNWYPDNSYLVAEYGPCNINLWNYNNDVIELYEDVDNVEQFERMNRVLFDNGVLVEYDPDVEYAYSNHDGALMEKARAVITTREVAKVSRGL